MILTENAFNEVIKLMYWLVVLWLKLLSFHLEPIMNFQELRLETTSTRSDEF